MDKLRVATLNIWNKAGPWAERLPLIRKQLTELAPDVLGLQEVLRLIPDELNPPTPSPSNCQACEIADGLGYNVAYGVAADYSGGLKFGNALLTRHKILDSRTFRLPGADSGETRSLLYALLETPWGRQPVFVTHLNWKLHHGVVRLKQVIYVAERIFVLAPVEADFLPPLLMGDFNAAPTADEIRYLKGEHVIDGRSLYFADAWDYAETGATGYPSPGYTYARDNGYALKNGEPNRRIDYIFVRGPDKQMRGEPSNVQLAFREATSGSEGTVWASDHYGVACDVSISAK
ncbi:MAG TPA: endonuclease/exonuclease/phosphatase family protein [Polyangiaceae bacterium]|nr:endonuclease/exonuclease/phosphatase family protein [Polyangiaceae bacterium]